MPLPRTLVWSYSSLMILRALSDSEESVATCGSVMFSSGCFAAEGFSVDALPPRSSSLLVDALCQGCFDECFVVWRFSSMATLHY
jgi:hypothetical protein